MDKTLNPKISVLISVFNCGPYIQESVESILNQTYPDFELIIVDDNSTDGTLEYLKSLTDKRIRLHITQKRTGFVECLNIGIDLAKGEYIARMDGDDIALPDRFEKQVAFMETNKDVIVCGGGYQIIGSQRQFIPRLKDYQIITELLTYCPFAHPTVFIRTKILKNNNIRYDVQYKVAEDYRLWTILSEFGKFANIPDIVLKYRIHSNQATKVKANEIEEITKLIAFDYVKKICSNHKNIEYFCFKPIITIDDLAKYNSIEKIIIQNFRTKEITIDQFLFQTRRKNYIIKGLYPKNYNILEGVKNLFILLRFRNLVGYQSIIKYCLKYILKRF